MEKDTWSISTGDIYKGGISRVFYVLVKGNATFPSFYSIEKGERQVLGEEPGEYPFFVSSMDVSSCNEYDNSGEFLLIGDGGDPSCHYINSKFAVSSHVFLLSPKERTNTEFINIYLRGHMSKWGLLYKGATIANISRTDLKQIRIPIPSKEEQERIVAQYNHLQELKHKLSDEIVELEKQMKELTKRT